jgi:hypothetical protein
MEKCISVPHNGKTIFAFLLRRRKYVNPSPPSPQDEKMVVALEYGIN